MHPVSAENRVTGSGQDLLRLAHSHRPVPAQHDRPLWPSDSSTRRSFACSAGWTQLAAEYGRHERVVGVGDVVADEHVCDRFPRAQRRRGPSAAPRGGPPMTDQPGAALSAELTTAADALRRRIASPSSFPHPFPQEYTLLTVSRLLDAIAHAGPRRARPRGNAWSTSPSRSPGTSSATAHSHLLHRGDGGGGAARGRLITKKWTYPSRPGRPRLRRLYIFFALTTTCSARCSTSTRATSSERGPRTGPRRRMPRR